MNARRLALAIFMLFTTAGMAQDVQVVARPLTDDDIKLIRQDIQSIKDQVITDTMQFTHEEAAAFWPIYKEYADKQREVAQKRLGVILDYAKQSDNLTDAVASNLTQRMLQIEDETQALRKSYFPKFETALGARRAAKFYQVDNRLTMIQNVQLASEVPLIQ